jgi:protein-tyrosine-phosphatase
MPEKRKQIYVGCRANVNRSFLLKCLLVEQITKTSFPIEVRSGGVRVAEGLPNMSYYPAGVIEFIQALQKTGLDFILPHIRQHQAHAFTISDLHSADLVITMTKRQRDHLKQYAPPASPVIMLSQLRDPSREEDVFDAMQELHISVEAFVWQIAQLQYYLNLESLKALLHLSS